MLETGFISLHRSLIKWDWYDDINTARLFIHLLLTVNYYDEKWHGEKVLRGTRITSYEKLAKETKLSVQEVRTALNKLKKTGEITCTSTNKYTLINVVNYNKFQDINFKINKQTNKQSTNNQQQINNNNNKNKYYIYTPQNKFKNYSDRDGFTPDEKINITKLMKKYGGDNDRYKN